MPPWASGCSQPIHGFFRGVDSRVSTDAPPRSRLHASARSRSSARVRVRACIRAYDVDERTIDTLHVIKITCLSHYFPESVSMAVVGN